ncbi:MAG: CBM21 domain-containing protein [Clostridia bacterium]|nr:CBM21 domain-containing protein [Clostridia bacterium]
MNRKNLFSKLLVLLLIFCIVFTALPGVFSQTANATSPNVELYYAKAPGYNPTSSFYAEGYIAIKNLAYNKKVTVVYKYGSSEWQEVAATYFSTSGDGYEAWYFKTPGVWASSCTFKIKYEVNGSIYWDDNGGIGYYMAWYAPTNLLQKSTVALRYSSKTQTALNGNIVLKNLAYNKQVKVRYTTDNWATYNDVNATYGTDLGNGLEDWNFSAPIPTGSTVKYAISYTVNGITYWDNNFGANYAQ